MRLEIILLEFDRDSLLRHVIVKVRVLCDHDVEIVEFEDEEVSAAIGVSQYAIVNGVLYTLG